MPHGKGANLFLGLIYQCVCSDWEKDLKIVSNFLITPNPYWMLPGFGDFFFWQIKVHLFKECRQVRNQSQISQKKMTLCGLNFTQSKNN